MQLKCTFSGSGGVLHPRGFSILGGFSIRGGSPSPGGSPSGGDSPSRGAPSRGGSPLGGSSILGGFSIWGGVPCDISHHAFDVTCMLPPHQLRHINSAPAYILLPGHVTCKACWDTHPPPSCG